MADQKQCPTQTDLNFQIGKITEKFLDYFSGLKYFKLLN